MGSSSLLPAQSAAIAFPAITPAPGSHPTAGSQDGSPSSCFCTAIGVGGASFELRAGKGGADSMTLVCTRWGSASYRTPLIIVFAWRMKMNVHWIGTRRSAAVGVGVAGGIVGHFDIVAGVFGLQQSRFVLKQRIEKARRKYVVGNDVDR